MSRCGSTLISQMLACLDRSIVISEAAPIDQIMHANLRIPGLTPEEHVRWLHSIIMALGQRRIGSETHYFVKLDAWHIHNLPLIRAAFPETPWIFVFRNPAEVVTSQLRNPGMHCLPGALPDPRALGLMFEDITALPREEWCVRVLERICQSALRFRDEQRGMFVDYSQLPEAVWGPISKHFCIRFDEDELRQMRQRASFHAKTRSPWGPAAEETILGGNRTALELCQRLLEPLYVDLKKLTTRGTATR